MPFSRRSFLAAAGAAPLVSFAKAGDVERTLKPRALKKGDLLSVIAPASAVDKPQDLDAARKTIERLGFRVQFGKHTLDRWGYFAGSDDARAADINESFADSTVAGIFCYTGGYGAGRTLELINYDLIRQNPKVLIGYSDITALLLAIHAKTGMVTFHGPVAVSEFSDYSVENFVKVVQTPTPAGLVSPPPQPVDPPYPSEATLHPGKARGRLVGGNLSVLTSILGSPYMPSFSGHILFLEDIGEEPYRVDRMLNSLWLSGMVKRVAGIVFGDFHARAERPFATADDASRTFTMLQILQNFANQVGVPCYNGAWFGHIREKYTLPLGIEAEMDADARTLTIVEPAVIG